MRNKNLLFFKTEKTKVSYADFIDHADIIVSQCRSLLASRTVDQDLRNNLTLIINKTTELLDSAKNDAQSNKKTLGTELTRLSLCLPESLPNNRNLGSMSTTIANVSLLLLAFSLSIFLGYLFFAAYHAYALASVAEAFVWTTSVDFIPFSLIGLFSHHLGKYFSEELTTIYELQFSITNFCLLDVDIELPSMQLQNGVDNPQSGLSLVN